LIYRTAGAVEGHAASHGIEIVDIQFDSSIGHFHHFISLEYGKDYSSSRASSDIRIKVSRLC
jgi:hypothetical protein